MGLYKRWSRGQALKRKGAREGDALVITGPMGLAAAVSACRQHQVLPPSTVYKTKRDARDCAPAEWLQRLHRPTPAIGSGNGVDGIAHAGIDISDGLWPMWGTLPKPVT